MKITPEQFEDAVIARLSEENEGQGREGFGDWIQPILDSLYQAIIDLGPTVANLTPNTVDDLLVPLAVKFIKQYKDKVKIAPMPE